MALLSRFSRVILSMERGGGGEGGGGKSANKPVVQTQNEYSSFEAMVDLILRLVEVGQKSGSMRSYGRTGGFS